MNIIEQLVSAFPQASLVGSIDDAFILANPNVMELSGPTDLFEVVPVYMLWCAKNSQDVGLATTYTLGALAEYGRCKSRDNAYLNFRYLCSPYQQQVVAAFLEWSSTAISFHNESQLERTIRNWKSSANNSFEADGFAAA
ncbi:hypothetical protein [Rhodanobacter sp. L36]|uniref:hypothetical protein n=1 Tax=Rhodanobacter sp. L36 TaxID=1747221 RepID=UPI00131BCB73|nr:hypothetical protein [Rhodanobacter sp. L36]